MKLLAQEDFNRVLEPLQKVSINNLFARSVVERHVRGKVYVDDLIAPQTYYVVHPYGMSLLFGRHDSSSFNETFRGYCLNTDQTRQQPEWMQAFGSEWHSVLEDLFQEKILLSSENTAGITQGIVELNTRVNFKFHLPDYLVIKSNYQPADIRIVPTHQEIFNTLQGSVVPLHFWDTAEDFLKRGAGFSVYYKDQLASTAYSSFVHENQFELGIETVEDFRGKGFAFHACMALLDYCQKNNYEPVWACRLENVGSYRLALKLGFKPSVTIPYFRLSS